jgi:hypothetical protein
MFRFVHDFLFRAVKFWPILAAHFAVVRMLSKLPSSFKTSEAKKRVPRVGIGAMNQHEWLRSAEFEKPKKSYAIPAMTIGLRSTPQKRAS